MKDGDRGITTSVGESKDKGPVMLQANAMFSGGSGGSTNEGPRSASGRTSLNDLSPAQMQRLLKLENVESHDRMMGMFSSSTWIFDTGATNHVIGNVVLLGDLCDFFSPLGLSDGKQVMATKRGCLHLDDLIISDNVYFVPNPCCNLISVSQLIDAHN